jgi:hypothetical protein
VLPTASALPTAGIQPTGTPVAATTPSPTATPEPSATPTASTTPTTSTTPEPVATPDVGFIAIGEPGQVRGLLAGDDALWGVSESGDSRSIFKVDPQSNEVETVVEGLPRLPNPIHGMAVNGSLWMTSWDESAIIEYDPTTGEELAEYPVGLHPIEPVYAFDDVWSLDHHGGTVSHMDTRAREVVTIEVGDRAPTPRGATAGGDLLWVVGLTEVIYGIDPQTNAVAQEIDTDIPCLMGVGYFADRLIVSSCEVPGMAQFDPVTGESLGPLELPGVPQLEVDGRLWLVAPSSGDYVERLLALDAQTLEEVDEFVLPGRFTAGTVAVAFDSFWVSGREGTVRIPADALRAVSSG